MEEQAIPTDTCQRHEGSPLIADCINCGKKICRECKDELGYFCSEECREASKNSVDHEAREEFNRKEEEVAKLIGIFKKSTFAILILVIGLLTWKVCCSIFDKSGKLAWENLMTISEEGVTVVDSSPTLVTLRVNNSIIGIDPENGNELFNKEQSSTSSLNSLVKKYDDKMLMRGSDTIKMLDMQGELIWSTSVKGNIAQIAVGDKSAVVLSILRPKLTKNYNDMTNEELKKAFKQTPFWNVIDLTKGKIIRSKKMDSNFNAHSLSASGDTLIYVTGKYENQKYTSQMKVTEISSGKELWQVNMGSFGGNCWLIGETIFLSTGKKLHAISKAGKKLWSISTGFYFNPDSFSKIYDNKIFIFGSTLLYCIDLANQKILWKKPVEVLSQDIQYTSGKLFFMAVMSDGEVPELEVKLPPSFEQLKGNEDLLKSMGGGGKTRLREDHMLFALDASNGDVAWKKKKIKGDIVTSEGKLLIVNDTSTTSLMNLANSGKGKMVITQIDPETGKEIFKRSNNRGLCRPYIIAGNRLIAVEYERVKTGLASFSEEDGGGYLGITALNIK